MSQLDQWEFQSDQGEFQFDQWESASDQSASLLVHTELTSPFLMVIRGADMKVVKQYSSTASNQKLGKLPYLPTSSWLSLIERLVIQTPSPVYSSNSNSSFSTSTSLRSKQCSKSVNPLSNLEMVQPLCLKLMSPPCQSLGPASSCSCWQRDQSSLEVTRIQYAEMLWSA